MSFATLSRKDAALVVKAVQACLMAGFKIGRHPGAVPEAARRLGLDKGTVYSRLLTAKRLYNLEPDLSKIKPEKEPDLDKGPTAAERAEATATRRIRDDNQRMKRELTDLRTRVEGAEDYREAILGLTREPMSPAIVKAMPTSGRPNTRTVILHLSDAHYGETVDLQEMDGTNSYNEIIAEKRILRFHKVATSLMTDYWAGRPPERIIMCYGGDLISGNIHMELEGTNSPTLPGTVRDMSEILAGGLSLMQKEVKCPIDVYSVPGNHGRTSLKPQSKLRADNSFDLLISDFVEMMLKREKGLRFFRTRSPDCYFSTYGWQWMLTHGDTMGFKGGGNGFIGPMATIIKGHRKLVDTSWRQGRAVHFVLTGHYHTTGKTSFGWADGSVIGYNQFVRDLRADPEPARQNMLVVHPEHGVINDQPIFLGHPSEGSHYAGPSTVIRPLLVEPER